MHWVRTVIRWPALAGLVLVSLVLSPAGAPTATAAPLLPLQHVGRWITDARGRVVVVHGINMVYKLPPYFPAAAGFSDDDAAFLSRSGFNVVRLGVIWKAVEPRPGAYNETHLRAIGATVNTLARHGILSLLDFHQDLLNERFQGEGAPAWAVQDGGLPNPALGFPGNYLANPALEHAIDAFWSNAPGPGGVGLQARFAAAWQRVATWFHSTRSVLGYDLYNEPFPGTQWTSCLANACPGFDAQLTSFYRRVDNAIRGSDPSTLVWYEPNVLFDEGFPIRVGSPPDPHAGLSFHHYCPVPVTTSAPSACSGFDDAAFSHALTAAAAAGSAVMLTEFGATDNVLALNDTVTRADRSMVPWIEWAYCGCADPTTTGPGTKQAIVIDPRKPPGSGNLELGTLHALVEPYPQVIAGTPQAWSFDRAARHFQLSYVTARARTSSRPFPQGSISEISTPALVYGRRYAARVSGGVVVSASGASLLRIASCPGAGTITVSVTASGSNHGSCRRPTRRHARAPRPSPKRR